MRRIANEGLRGMFVFLNRVVVLLTVFVASAAHSQNIPPGLDSHNHEFTSGLITGQAQTSFLYEIARVHICNGYDFIDPKGTVDWDDKTPGDMVTIPPPKANGQVVGQHLYQAAGVYHITWVVKAVCVNGHTPTGYAQQWEDQTPPNGVTATATAYIFDAPISTKGITCISPVAPKATVRCVVTLQTKASLGGTQVRIMTDNAMALFVPPAFIIRAGLLRGTFSITGLVSGTANVYVTSGVGTPTQTVAVAIK